MLNLKKLLPHIPTIIACALIVAVGIIWTVWSSPGITTIGEDISATNITATNDLTVSGSASLATTTADNLTVSGSTGLATTTATGLTVSGDLSATGTISEGGTLLSSKYIPAPGNATTGDVLYYNGTDWVRLGTGESGQFLQSQGPGSTPKWATVSAGLTGFYTIDRADKSTDTTGEWVDVDCSDIVPEGAKAVYVLFVGGGNFTVPTAGVRKNGATDEGTFSAFARYDAGAGRVDLVELDANRIFEQKIGNYHDIAQIMKTYIVGYLK